MGFPTNTTRKRLKSVMPGRRRAIFGSIDLDHPEEKIWNNRLQILDVAT